MDVVGREQEDDVVFVDSEVVEESVGKLGDFGIELGVGECFEGVGVDEGGFGGERRDAFE